MVTCAIQWIDSNGKPTPDTNEAIGSALCTTHYADGTITKSEAFPICRDHLARMQGTWVPPMGRPAYAGIRSQHWTFAPYASPEVR